MVAIKDIIKSTLLTLLTALTLLWSTPLSAQGGGADGSIMVPIEELSGNLAYMSLLTLDAKYSAESDSLNKAVAEYRKLFLGGGDKAMDAQMKIISLEQSIFNIRTERNSLKEQIETIEKHWKEQNSESGNAGIEEVGFGGEEGVDIYQTEIVGLISQSSIVGKTLSEDDLGSLVEADSSEAEISTLYNKFMSNYLRASELQQLYLQTEVEKEALTYYDEFEVLQENMDSISEILTPIWRKVYDDKVFIYSLLLEMLNNNSLLQDGLNSIRKAEMNASEIGDDVASEAVLSYMYKKQALVEFEATIAERFNLPRAADSLFDVAQKLTAQKSSSDLAELSIKERSFIPYAPIVYSTSATYSNSNAIPQTPYFSKGDVYRIQFGAYKTQQNPSIFKGAAPLSVERIDGLYTYYGGSYATYIEAEAAAAEAKKRGFNRPEMVVWLNGERRNLFRTPLPASNGYNIVIDGLPELASESSSIVELLGGGATLTRISTNKYVISPLKNILIAEDLVDALSNVNREVEFSINEIAD